MHPVFIALTVGNMETRKVRVGSKFMLSIHSVAILWDHLSIIFDRPDYIGKSVQLCEIFLGNLLKFFLIFIKRFYLSLSSFFFWRLFFTSLTFSFNIDKNFIGSPVKSMAWKFSL